MKRNVLLRHLRRHGYYLKREGREHSLWCNPTTGAVETIPRHTEIPSGLHAKSVVNSQCLKLGDKGALSNHPTAPFLNQELLGRTLGEREHRGAKF